MDADRARRAEELISRMKAARGYIYREWEFAARADPDLVDAYNELYRRSLGDGQVLDAKTREFVAIGILAFRNEAEALRTHIQRAMRLGATKEEIVDALAATIVPGGAPSFRNGLEALIDVLEMGARP